MRICRVVGEVVATVKHPSLEGRKLLIVQPVGERDRPDGKPQIAIDTVDAGPGERVLLCDEGGSAALALGKDGPIRSVIVGRIDGQALPWDGAGGGPGS